MSKYQIGYLFVYDYICQPTPRFSMRKLVLAFALTICALFAGIQSANAQWYITPTAGVNFTSISTNNPTPGLTVDPLIQINGGVSVRKQFSKQFSAQADVLFSQMGAKYTVSADGVADVVTNNQYSYVQVPLYINFEVPFMPDNLIPYRVKESVMSAHFMGGGYFGYGLSGAIPDSDYNPIDFGLALGAGFSFKLDPDNKKRLVVGGRYLLSIPDFNKSDQIKSTHSPIVQGNVGLQVKLGNRRHIRYSR